MDDTIYRQAAIAAIKEWGLIDGLSEGQAIEILADEEKVPSAQPEIIRCKDCKYHERYRRISVKWLPCMEIRTDGNWFCASAERREE